jgi:poly(A) polymerase
MLRAVRFAAQFDFELIDRDMRAIRDNAYLIEDISPERIREEFNKAFRLGVSARFVSLLWSSGLLYHILPEVSRMQLTEQDSRYHPEGDALTHTVRTLRLMPDANVNLAWAGLLHDIGKPDTTVFEENGRITSKGHDKLSSKLAEEILDRLKFSNDDKEHILFLVRNHMKPTFAKNMKLSKVKALVSSKYSKDLIRLAITDAFSTGRKDIDMAGVRRMEDILNSPPEVSKPEPLLRGRDLIDMGFKPGPIFKEILDYIYDAQLDGEIDTTEKAKEMVARKWMKQ